MGISLFIKSSSIQCKLIKKKKDFGIKKADSTKLVNYLKASNKYLQTWFWNKKSWLGLLSEREREYEMID